MIRVLLAEDQAMVRGALSALLEPRVRSRRDRQRGERRGGVDADRARQSPTSLVTDIEMPQLTGLELAQRIRERGVDCKVIILTTFARPGFLRRALDAGVGGYLLRRRAGRTARRSVAQGASRRACDRSATRARSLVRRPIRSTTASVRCCAWPAKACPRARSPSSCTCPRARCAIICPKAIGKLGVGNRIEAYRLARQKGWLQSGGAGERTRDAVCDGRSPSAVMRARGALRGWPLLRRREFLPCSSATIRSSALRHVLRSSA